MTILENFAHKHPAFVTQLAAVIRGRKPVVRVEFELHGEDYAGFIDLLTMLKLVWFEHSPTPVRICYPTSLQKSVEIKVKNFPWYAETENYRFLRFYANLNEYDKFWQSLTEGKIIPLELEGGDLDSSFETIIAKDFEGLMNFLTQYALAKTQFSQTQQSDARELFDRILGTAFGYPECCTERFTVEREKRRGKEDYLFYESIIEKGLEKSVPAEFKVIAHVPCSVLCQPSINLGREYLAALKEYDSEVYEIVTKELTKPTLFIDLWHQFPITELDYESIDSLMRTGRDDFLNIAEKESFEPKEVTLGRIENVPFQYQVDFVGLWWIGVNPGDTVLLRNAETGEIRLYRRHNESNIADLRIYRYKS